MGTIGSAQNEPTWTNLSVGTYNGNIRNGRTGARRLDLPLVQMGAQPIDLIRRPVVNSAENVNNAGGLRPALLTRARACGSCCPTPPPTSSALPGVTATAPVRLADLRPRGELRGQPARPGIPSMRLTRPSRRQVA